MKTTAALPMMFALSLIASAASPEGDSSRERTLHLNVEPIDTMNIMQTVVWDFSDCDIIDSRSGMDLNIYGDSLIAESVAGYRRWYVLSGDTLGYAGDESRTRLMAVSRPAATFIFPLRQGESCSVPFEGKGRIYSIMHMDQTGTIITHVGPSGRLITAGHDTIPAVTITHEHRQSVTGTGRFAGDSLYTAPADSLTYAATDIYRWYAEGDMLPLAIMESVAGNEWIAYQIDPLQSGEEIPQVNTESQSDLLLSVAEALRSVLTVYLDGELTVSLCLPESAGEIPLSVDIVDAAGNIFRHTDFTVSGNCSVTVQTDGLTPRDYIAVISTPLLPESIEKRHISIR